MPHDRRAATALVNLLAWKARAPRDRSQGRPTYVNPVDGTTKYLYNISGHRNVNATACPGELFYNTFPHAPPGRRQQDRLDDRRDGRHTRPRRVLASSRMVPGHRPARTRMRFGLIFKEPVTGLAAGDFTVGGIIRRAGPSGIVTGKASTYTVTVVRGRGWRRPHGWLGHADTGTNAVTDKAGTPGPTAAVTADRRLRRGDRAAGRRPLRGQHARRAGRDELRRLGASSTSRSPASPQPTSSSAARRTPPRRGRPRSCTARAPTSTSRCPTRAPADGTLTIQIAGRLGDGPRRQRRRGSNVITRTIDHSAPVTSAPTDEPALRHDPQRRRASRQLTWTGNDVGPAGISSFDVQRSYDGQASRHRARS